MKHLQKFRNLWPSTKSDHIKMDSKSSMLHDSCGVFGKKESDLHTEKNWTMQSPKISSEILNTTSFGSKATTSIPNISNSTSITIADLRDYWNNQLYQQKHFVCSKLFSRQSCVPSDHAIEPWMLWLPTKEEWSYRILPVTREIYNSAPNQYRNNYNTPSLSSDIAVAVNRYSSKYDIQRLPSHKNTIKEQYVEYQNQKNESKLKRITAEWSQHESKILEMIREDESTLESKTQKAPQDFRFQEFSSRFWTTGATNANGSSLQSTTIQQVTTTPRSNDKFEANVFRYRPVKNQSGLQNWFDSNTKLQDQPTIHESPFETTLSFPNEEFHCNQVTSDMNVVSHQDTKRDQLECKVISKDKRKDMKNKNSKNSLEVTKKISKNLKDWRCSFTIQGFNLSDYHRRSKRYRMSQQKDAKKLKIKSHFNFGRWKYTKKIPLYTTDFDLHILVRKGIKLMSLVVLATVILCSLYLLRIAVIHLTATKQSAPTLYLIEHQIKRYDELNQYSSSRDISRPKHHVTYKSTNITSTIDQTAQNTEGHSKRRISRNEIYSPNTRNLKCFIIHIRVTENRSTGERMLSCKGGICEFEGVAVNLDPEIDLTNIKRLRNLYLRLEIKFHINYIETDDIMPKQEIVTMEEYYNEYLIMSKQKKLFYIAFRNYSIHNIMNQIQLVAKICISIL